MNAAFASTLSAASVPWEAEEPHWSFLSLLIKKEPVGAWHSLHVADLARCAVSPGLGRRVEQPNTTVITGKLGGLFGNA
jgi:hypothetical protein